MPRATVNTEATRFDLKSLPGGFVDLRPLPFGQMLERREKASKMSMEQNTRKNQKQIVNFDMMQKWTRDFEFKHCIIDHNLEDDQGNKLNFSLAGTLDILDPKVGAEIERYIDELNQEEDDEDLENFPQQSMEPSRAEPILTDSSE